MTRRTRALLLLALPLVATIALFVPDAGASTITVNPNNPGISCHLAFSSTTSDWATGTITVQGDCNSPNMLQTGLGGSYQGSACIQYATCAYSSADPVTAQFIAFLYWTGTEEIEGYIAAIPTSSAANQYTTGCGFNEGDVAINDTPTTTYGGGWDTEEDTTATAALDASPPTLAGTYQNLDSSLGGNVYECTTNGSDLKIIVGVGNDTEAGDLGTASYLVLNNSECQSDYYVTDSTDHCVDVPYWGNRGFEGPLSLTTNDDVPAACTLVSITGNTAQPVQQSGVSYGYSIQFGGNADYIIAADDEDTNTADEQTIEGKTFEIPYLKDVDPGPSLTAPQTIDYQAAIGDTVNPHFWCYANDQWYDWGTLNNDLGLNPPVPAPNTGTSPDGDCFAADGWVWDDPVTWVTGALHDGECILEALFVPSICTDNQTNVASCVNWPGFENALKTKVPTAYAWQSITAASTLITGVNTELGTGSCDTPTIAPWNGDTTGVGKYLASLSVTIPSPSDLGCSGPNSSTVGNLFGARLFIWYALAIGIWMSTVAILWRLLPWHRRGDGIQIIEQFGGLSDHIMENGVEVYQTNEGSDR